MLTPEQAERLASDLFDDDATDAEPVEPAAVPARIAGYRIIRVLASGGMGTVYEAQQEHPHRTVALKVLRSGLTSRSTLKRFHYEAEVLGHLQHPGIAQVYDAGTHDDGAGGVPYFVMELIPGARPITTYADDHGLTIRQRLELFTQVCDAVHYGHQKGIIHRDLKPANILVADETAARAGDGGSVSRRFVDDSTAATAPSGGQSSGGTPSGGFSSSESQEIEPATVEGEGAAARAGDGDGDVKPADARANEAKPTPAAMPTSGGGVKVIDFGIARATNSDITLTTMQTDARHLLGTLQYMSPEQAIGNAADLDMRSDVYSLGVVLYELLCGRLPYDLSDSSIPHATRQIQEAEPPHPSTVSRSLRGDVGTIVLKALEKDRAKRYQSVADLCRDIQHYLKGEPIEARPASAWMKSVRWVGRHPVVTTTAACVLISGLTISATLLSIWVFKMQPHSIELSKNRQEAGLFSIAGELLHSWRSDAEGGISFAELVDRPADFGGGKLAILGYSSAAKNEYPGSVCAFALDHYETPFWKKRIEQHELIAPFLAADTPIDAIGFSTHPESMVVDVFPGDAHPGKEIAVLFSHSPSSPAVLRVYDLSGRLLYQIWHDGTINDMHWLPASRAFVLVGVNSEVYWSERGEEGPKKHHPHVVFAVRPVVGYGYFGDRIVTTTPGGDLETIDFYKCLLPAADADRIDEFRLERPEPGEDASRSCRLIIGLRDNPSAAVSWLIDENGIENPALRRAGDGWKADLTLPDWQTFLRLGELPPIVAEPNGPDE